MYYKEKSFAKVNIFLKIVALRGDYHEIVSRFVRVKSLFDEIEIKKVKKTDEFKLVGEFGCKIEQNTIYKAYEELIKKKPEVEKYLKEYEIKVDKNIPYFAGLGGGSSNSATFLKMVNKMFELNLTKQELAEIGGKVGADVSFFIYDYFSANVSGIGEIVEEFSEDEFDIEVVTNNIKCDTKEVYTYFRKYLLGSVDKEYINILSKQPSKYIFDNLSLEEANDLYKSAKKIYPNLISPKDKKYFFSGSGSSFFTIKD